MSRYNFAWLVLAVTLPIAPAATIAQMASLPPEAEAALAKGLAAANAQQWETAIQNFQEARKIAPGAPELYYDLGLAESKIPGRELRAVAWFGAYLAANPHAANAAAVKVFIAELQIKIKANIHRLIQAAEVADNSLPDTPITHNGGITGKYTNSADQDRMMSLYDVANLWASAGNSAKAIEAAHRLGQAGYNENYSLSQIVVAQAGAGYIADAIKTTASFDDVNESKTARLAIAAAQAKAGDLAAARATLLAAQARAGKERSAYMRNSLGVNIAEAQAKIGDISGAEKTAGMMPSPVAKTWVYLAIAEAQTKAADLATARANLALAQIAADLWNSLRAAQKKAACECALSEPRDQSVLAFVQLRIGEMLANADDLAGARSALRRAQGYTKLISSAQSRSSQAAQIVEAQANAGDIAGAQDTSKLISDARERNRAAIGIVKGQAKAGDFAGAQRTVESLRDPTAILQANSAISDEQAKRASPSQVTASGSTPSSNSPPAQPAISASDWSRELDALNTPLFLDLSGSVMAPLATYKVIAPGASSEPTETETKKTFRALMAISRAVIFANNTVDEMLQRQFAQAAKP